MPNRTLKAAGLALILASCVAAVLFLAPAAAPARADGGKLGHLTKIGSVALGNLPASVGRADGPLALEFSPAREIEAEASGAGKGKGHIPKINPKEANPVTTSNPGFSGFNGLTHQNQRLANGGNQFSLEPPDQGLCVGNGKVLETVNTVLRVRSESGANLTGVIDLNSFFGLPAQIIRTPVVIFGPFLSDPKCYFDGATGRFFLTVLEADLNPVTGDFTGPTAVLIAVSQTGDPTGSWNLFSLNTTNDPSPTDCTGGCLPDQPLIGADENGFYVSTNAFSGLSTGAFAFLGAQIYAIDKGDLVSGTTPPTFVHFQAPPTLGDPSFSIQPATSPPGGASETAAGGTEFFLAALDFDGTSANKIAVWALTNTSSLSSSTPSLSLVRDVVSTELYGQPPDAEQKPGPPGSRPLGEGLHEPLEKLAGNDDRMNEVKFADGLLWGAVNTAIQPPRIGIAFFIVTPSVDGAGQVSGTIAKQGYVSVFGENVMFPAFGVNASGDALMTFTLVGRKFFPSAAYTRIGGPEDPDREGNGPVHLAAAGAGPEDGFSGYAAFGGNGTARWGDYSAATAAADGSIWFATEFIPGGPRTLFANWGTFIGHVVP